MKTQAVSIHKDRNQPPNLVHLLMLLGVLRFHAHRYCSLHTRVIVPQLPLNSCAPHHHRLHQHRPVMAPKRKAVPANDEEGADVQQEPKKTKAPKAPKLLEPFEDNGWHTLPGLPALIYKDYGSKPAAKIAAIDLDGTLVNVKSTAKFPKDANDWKFFNKSVVQIVRGYHESGYKVVIFSNQGGIKGSLAGKAASNCKERVGQIQAKLDIPLQVFLAPQDDHNRKPETGMWEFMVQHSNGNITPDLSQCFYVGDAAGRAGDHDVTDKEFAANIGIKFQTPEEAFGEMDGKKELVSASAPTTDINAELVDIFQRLKHMADSSGEGFKARAYGNVATVLASFPEKIVEGNLKEVGKLKGVGKGSLGVIKEWLTTGKVEILDSAEGPTGKEAMQKAKEAETVNKNTALQFM